MVRCFSIHYIMLFYIIYKFLRKQPDTYVPLGRWGHHWEKRLLYQKYYE